MGKGRLTLAIGAALAVLLFLSFSGIADPLGIAPHSYDDDSQSDPGWMEFEDRRLEELRKRATLRGIPGIDVKPQGVGILSGFVKQQLPDGDARPLVGVNLKLLGIDAEGRAVVLSLVTDETGLFEKHDLQANFGYELVIDHKPFRRRHVESICVRANRTTDLGTIFLGSPTTLLGKVHDDKGRVPVGAKVSVFRDQSRPDSFDLRGGLFELQGAFDSIASAEVQGDGTFAVKDLSPGRYLLRVAAPGYATAFRSGVIVTLDELSTTPHIILDPGAGYYGKVHDEEGRGIGGARVIAVAIPGERAQRIDRVDVTTAPDGRYRLDTLIPGVRYFLEAWADGFAPSGQFTVVADGVDKKDIELAVSGRVEGRVTDAETGAGIENAEVTIVAGTFSSLSPVSTHTDASGNYVFPNVNPGAVILIAAKAEGYQIREETNLGAVNGMKVVAGETLVFDWQLSRGAVIRGTVTERGGGPLAYVTLAFVDRRNRMRGEVTALSDERGAYVVDGLWPGEFELRVTAPGYAPPLDAEQTRVTIEESTHEHLLDVTLERGATVRGVIMSPDGLPVAGARVVIEAGSGRRVDNRVRDLNAVSNRVGTFTIHGVPPRVEVFVIADHDEYVRTTSAPRRFSPGQDVQVELQLLPGVSLRGTVEDERRVAIAGARVRWGHVEADQAQRIRDSFRADQYLGTRVLRTDDNGAFVIDRVEPGLTLVKVEHDGYVHWFRKDLTIGAEGDPPPLKVTLQGALSVSGRVLDDATGRGVAGVFVYARERKPEEGRPDDPGRVKSLISAETTADGSFTLTGLPPGSHEVVVWFAAGYVSAAQNWNHASVRKQDIAAGAKNVTFRLVRPAPEEPQ